MGQKIDYPLFLQKLDNKIESYYASQSDYVCCQKGCSSCCEKGDYPLSDIELEYEFMGAEGDKYDITLDNQIQKALEVLSSK